MDDVLAHLLRRSSSLLVIWTTHLHLFTSVSSNSCSCWLLCRLTFSSRSKTSCKIWELFIQTGCFSCFVVFSLKQTVWLLAICFIWWSHFITHRIRVLLAFVRGGDDRQVLNHLLGVFCLPRSRLTSGWQSRGEGRKTRKWRRWISRVNSFFFWRAELKQLSDWWTILINLLLFF